MIRIITYFIAASAITICTLTAKEPAKLAKDEIFTASKQLEKVYQKWLLGKPTKFEIQFINKAQLPKQITKLGIKRAIIDKQSVTLILSEANIFPVETIVVIRDGAKITKIVADLKSMEELGWQSSDSSDPRIKYVKWTDKTKLLLPNKFLTNETK